MKIGVRVHDLGRDTPENLAKKAKEIGFDCVQLVCNKALIGEKDLPTELNSTKVKTIYEAFKMENIEIAMLGAYFNPVHSNEEKVEIGVKNFSNFLKYQKAFHAQFVGSETGSFNDEPWIYHPKNRTETGFLQMKDVFKKLARVAEENEAKIALEGAYGHVCYEPKVLRRLYDEIGSESIYFTIDLYNYLSNENYQNYLNILNDAIAILKDRTVIFHLKDFIVEDGKLKQVDLGKGIIDYPKVLEIMLKNCPDAYYIFEGVTATGMEESYNFIKQIEKGVK